MKSLKSRFAVGVDAGGASSYHPRPGHGRWGHAGIERAHRKWTATTPSKGGDAVEDELDDLLRQLVRTPKPFGPDVALKPGATPRFEVLRPLGRGSHGAVWLVRDLLTSADVALKTLNPHLVGLLSQLKKEFRALANLRHENLVSFYEMFVTHEHHFFTMEYVPGVTFREWARRDVSEDGREIRAALAQLARGLAALHGAGKLHRDIKPANVLITEVRAATASRLRARHRHGRAGTRPGRARRHSEVHVTRAGARGPGHRRVRLVRGRRDALRGARRAPSLPTTRRLPARGPNATARAAPSDARSLVPEAKRDLAELAMRLLSREPELRPGAAEILASLGLAAIGAPSSRSAAGDGRRGAVRRPRGADPGARGCLS